MCQYDLRKCNESLCRNFGTCYLGFDGLAQCNCNQIYTGLFCETRKQCTWTIEWFLDWFQVFILAFPILVPMVALAWPEETKWLVSVGTSSREINVKNDSISNTVFLSSLKINIRLVLFCCAQWKQRKISSPGSEWAELMTTERFVVDSDDVTICRLILPINMEKIFSCGRLLAWSDCWQCKCPDY